MSDHNPDVKDADCGDNPTAQTEQLETKPDPPQSVTQQEPTPQLISYQSYLSKLQQDGMSFTKLPQPCKRCGKFHDSVTAMDLLMYPKIVVTSCNICGLCFTRSCLLQSHLQHHLEANPYQCYLCTRFFINKQSLRVHLFTHSETAPFRCHMCRQSFMSRTQFLKHQENQCYANRPRIDQESNNNLLQTTQTPIYKKPDTLKSKQKKYINKKTQDPRMPKP